MTGRRLNPNSDAWGGAWGSASAWGGTWGWSWSPLHEVEDERYYGGGGTRYRGRKEPDPEEQLHRDHWDYMDSLREIQDKAAKEVVHVSADRVVSSRAMRGKVKALEQHQAAPTAAEGIIGNPILITALMALIDDE